MDASIIIPKDTAIATGMPFIYATLSNLNDSVKIRIVEYKIR